MCDHGTTSVISENSCLIKSAEEQTVHFKCSDTQNNPLDPSKPLFNKKQISYCSDKYYLQGEKF